MFVSLTAAYEKKQKKKRNPAPPPTVTGQWESKHGRSCLSDAHTSPETPSTFTAQAFRPCVHHKVDKPCCFRRGRQHCAKRLNGVQLITKKGEEELSGQNKNNIQLSTMFEAFVVYLWPCFNLVLQSVLSDRISSGWPLRTGRNTPKTH